MNVGYRIGYDMILDSQKRTGLTNSHPHRSLPLLVWVVIVVTLLGSLTGGLQIFSFFLTGWAWVIPFVASGFRLSRFLTRVSFPVLLWIPWILWLLLYLVFYPQENALQRTIMLLCPILVGVAVSSLCVDQAVLNTFGRQLKVVTVFYFVMLLVKMGVFERGSLPDSTALASQAMTASLLATIFAVRFAQGERKSIGFWAMMAVVPVMAVTRTGVVAAALTLPLTLGPMKVKYRVLILAMLALGGLGLFYTERFQQKMFYSGSGSLDEVSLDNPDFRTSGRAYMWEGMEAEIKREPWFGHGANAQETYVRRFYGGLAHPHNDWLRLLYDYGYLGTGLFALTLLGQLIHLWRTNRRSPLRNHWLFLASASAFLPFVLFMFTDNIILYAAFFGNLHFAMLGMVYAAIGNQGKRSLQPVVARYSQVAESRTASHVQPLGPLVGWKKISR